MSLHHAILGLLSNRSMKGDVLVATFTRDFHQFWSAGPCEVRRSLDRLVQAELARADQEHHSGANFDRTYELTDLGASVLEDWMAADLEVYPHRDVFLLRLSLTADLGPEAAQAMFDQQITTVGERLTALRKVDNEQALIGEGGHDLARALAAAANAHEIAVAKAELVWAAHWREKAEAWLASQDGSPTSRSRPACWPTLSPSRRDAVTNKAFADLPAHREQAGG